MKLFLIAEWRIYVVAMSMVGLLLSNGAAHAGSDAPGEEAARILAAHCLECHSGPEPKGKLDLSTRASALAGGETAPAVVPGNLADSLLWKQVVEDEMPPKKKLAAGDKEILRRWVEAGARYAEDPIDLFKVTAGQRAGYDWWSLRPVKRPAPPEVRKQNWIRNPIDAFVLAKLEASGIEHAPNADPRILIRRLYFDLIGLPPQPEVIKEFVESSKRDSQAAIEAAADKLLNSPNYGERWARHWLDVSRYGESNGFEYDKLRGNAWRFRDWVIEALNNDMPYDRFVQLQIAGDVLEPDSPDAIIATSFLVCGAFDGLIPQGNKQRKIMRQDEMEDLVGTVAQSFLGLTVHCARCHDHKFDPIRQKEYYQMASALGGVRRGDRAIPPDADAVAWSDRIEVLTQKVTDLEQPIREAILADLAKGPREGLRPGMPTPVSRWTFDAGFKDELGELHGAPKGGARIDSGALWLDGKDAYVATAPLSVTFKSKTLEAWVKLENLEQRGGAAVSVQGLDGGLFDAVVFGEREPGRWMAGSNGLSRTQSFHGEVESEALSGFVHVAIVYSDDGTITGYRNGLPYGKPYKSKGLATFNTGQSQVIFGLRHGTGPVSGRMLSGWIDRAQLYDRALSAEEIAASASATFVSEEQLVAGLNAEQQKERDDWKEEIVRLSVKQKQARGRKAFAVTPRAAPVEHLLVRGSPFQPSDVVAAGGVAAVGGGVSDFGLDPDAPEADRRAALAEWITHPDNPLFARVMVNRIWHYHFGQGLIKTPNDFGYNGGIPSHPELLDWLAAEFQAIGWSMKEMHRLIVTSAAYQQSSALNASAREVDAGNRLIWRRTPARLEAETLRDTILAVAGQLNPAMGGAGFRDFDMRNHKGSWIYDPIDPEGAAFNRRSIYRTWARGSKHPLLSTFDCPDPSATAPVRGVTTTPLGALSLMNNSFILRMADHFAERLRNEAGDDAAEQILHAYQLAFGRGPNPEELSLTMGFAAKNGLPALCRVLFNSNEFLYVN